MYLHLGNNTIIIREEIVGIFDLETSTISQITRKYLANAEKNGRVINVSFDLPKSFVVCKKNANSKERVYITALSSSTLLKRIKLLNQAKQFT